MTTVNKRTIQQPWQPTHQLVLNLIRGHKYTLTNRNSSASNLKRPDDMGVHRACLPLLQQFKDADIAYINVVGLHKASPTTFCEPRHVTNDQLCFIPLALSLKEDCTLLPTQVSRNILLRKNLDIEWK